MFEGDNIAYLFSGIVFILILIARRHNHRRDQAAAKKLAQLSNSELRDLQYYLMFLPKRERGENYDLIRRSLATYFDGK